MAKDPSEKEIFIHAIGLEEGAVRSGFLDMACAGDRELRERVEKLLGAAADDDDGFLQHSPADSAELLGAVSPLDLGARIGYFGDYELLEVIASGAMGVVYEACQTSLKRTVAVKMIRSGLLVSDRDVQRFRNEAEAAALLDHPNIVPIYEIGEFEGQYYYSMRLVRGGTLADHMPALTQDHRSAAALIERVALAVHAAHQHGILHRDLKPGNILIGEDGAPQVTDFGLAKQLDGNQNMTQSGQLMGTPLYMAPEQALGGAKALTTAADIYSLGAVLYEILAGRAPFKSDSILGTLTMAREQALPRMGSQVDRDLETITRKCLEKDPLNRYESAGTFADDLARWRRGEPITARPATPVERIVKWARRRPAQAALAATASLLLLTLGIGGPLVAFRQKQLAGEAVAARTLTTDNLYIAEMNLARARRRIRHTSLQHGRNREHC